MQDTNTQTWAMIKMWAPDIAWSAPIVGTNGDLITIDSMHSIPANAIQAQFITATVGLDEFDRIFVSGASRIALNDSAKQLGWKVHLELDADGPHGTSWGYSMDGNDGVRFLMISVIGKNCTTSNDRPVECSTFDAKVTVTDAVSPESDL